MSFEVKKYNLSLNNERLMSDINFVIGPGEIMTLMGPSGCGKSTFLADLSGVLSPVFNSTGEMTLNNENIKNKPIEKRCIGILFQDDLLFPHLNVFENLVFGLPHRLTFTEKNNRIKQALKNAELIGYEHRDIATLSGGQKSRISLLRTLLSEPKLLLLDEPFSKLDNQLRSSFRALVFKQIKDLSIPAVLVTHDAEDIPEFSKVITLEPPHA